MLSREIAFALCLRDLPAKAAIRRQGATELLPEALPLVPSEVLLTQRPESQSVMPGLWELPALKESAVPDADLRMTVRHAIMQVNYYVRIRDVREAEVDALTDPSATRRWVPLAEAASLPLTGLARKVLTRAQLLPGVARDSIARQPEADLL